MSVGYATTRLKVQAISSKRLNHTTGNLIRRNVLVLLRIIVCQDRWACIGDVVLSIGQEVLLR